MHPFGRGYWGLAGNDATPKSPARALFAISSLSHRLARFLFLIALLSPLAGCISAIDSVPDGDLAFASAETDNADPASVDPDAVDLAAVDPTAAVPAAGMLPAEAAVSTNANGLQVAADNLPPASAVPEPAPRDGAGNPRLGDGIELAFASPQTDPANTGSIPQPDQTAIEAAAPPVQAAAFVPRAAPAQRTLFEFLFQRHKAREAPQVRLASLAPARSTDRRRNAGSSVENGATLPGVRSRSQLFGDIDDEHEGEQEGYQVASVGAFGRLSPNGLRVQTDKVDVGCLKPQLVAMLGQIERHYGKKPVVTSGFRSQARNRRAGGARRSLHMQCMAADIQVEGVSKWDLAKYLRTVPGRGGVGTYCRTHSVHIDIGEIRDWHYPCRRVSKRKS